MPAFQKQFAKQALTKTSWYPVMKQTLKYIGIKVTKDGVASGASKVIPLVGGFLSGGMTFVSLQSQSHRLKNHLRELPAPGVDAEVWKQAVSDATPDVRSRAFWITPSRRSRARPRPSRVAQRLRLPASPMAR